MRRIVVATNNKSKLKEIREIFEGYDFEFVTPKELGCDDFDVVEDGLTFEANALKKAEHAFKLFHMPVIADDSGISVHHLEGRPGIYTARYNAEYPYSVRKQKMIEALEGAEDRAAYYTCAVAFVYKEIKEVFTGYVHGEIHTEDIGENGFGYDGIFFYKPFNRTFGEVDEDLKNKVSHRYNALIQLERFLRDEGSGIFG